MDIYDEMDDFDVMPLCSNCKYDGANWSCNCKQKAEDIRNHCEKPRINDFCGYFEEQEWITKMRKENAV